MILVVGRSNYRMGVFTEADFSLQGSVYFLNLLYLRSKGSNLSKEILFTPPDGPICP
jgi:hypothetical protein